MSLNHVGYERDALPRRDVRQANQTGVLEALDVHEFSEIGVDRDQNPALGARASEQHPIARIGAELAGLDDVMTLGAQPLGQLGTDAAIDEELHGFATETAANVSWAITAWA